MKLPGVDEVYIVHSKFPVPSMFQGKPMVKLDSEQIFLKGPGPILSYIVFNIV